MRIRAGMTAATAAAAMMLGGCATTALRSYVGGDLQAIAARYGPPTTHTLLPNGTDRFQWVVAYHHTPANSVPLSTFVPLKTASLQARSAAAQAGAIFGGMCVYTVFARHDAAAGTWTVTGFQAPRIDCD